MSGPPWCRGYVAGANGQAWNAEVAGCCNAADWA
jgi:hypothetical protein